MTTFKHNNQLNTYLSATILLNLFFLFMNGYGADLGFWENWSHQLADKGYYLFNGNYPPLYIHWLYIVSKGLQHFHLPIEPNDLCKFLWEIPVLLSHCLLTWLVFKSLQKSNATSNQTLCIMLLTVCNPAILINGPIWGQVDLIPATLAVCALLLHFSKRYAFLMLPLYTLSLLTKFQMVCFSPVIGILFFYRFKAHLLGSLLSLLTIVMVFSPFIYVGYYKEAFLQAYVHTLGQYPVITMNAANLWVLLVGNNAPDTIPFLSHISPLLPQKLAYPKYLGMFLYAAICLGIFIIGLSQFIKNRRTPNDEKLLASVMFYAMLSAIGFFTLLPAMHERYLFPAVICAIMYSAVTKKYIGYAIGLSAASALNMIIIVAINGSDIWIGLSTLVTLIFVLSLLQLFAGGAIYTALTTLIKRFLNIPYSSLLVFIISVGATLTYLVDRYSSHDIELSKNQSLLTAHKLISAQQDHGSMHYGRSMDRNALSVGNRRFANGIGTHSNSKIIFQLPDDAISFDVIPGVDDEVGSADLIFEVWEDNRLLWRSAPYFGFEKAKNIHIKLHKGSQLTLKVDSHGETSWDHADWINPIITVENL